jgi:hypothetical protein
VIYKYFIKISSIIRNLGSEISSFREVLILKLKVFSLKVKLKLVFKVLLKAYIGCMFLEEGFQ